MKNNLIKKIKEGKKITPLEEDDLFNCDWKYLNLLMSYVNDVLQERSLRFEKRIESHSDIFKNLFGVNEDELLFYIKKIIKGPWPKIEKHLTEVHLQRYKLFLVESGFEEYII
jgi:hypothetical protein